MIPKASKNIFVYTAISGAFTFQRPAAYNSSMQPIDLRVAWQYGLSQVGMVQMYIELL